jgi:p70 ribosomal S6 kinase
VSSLCPPSPCLPPPHPTPQQTSKKLYLVLDFINGGHLFFQLYRQGTFDEPLARLYTAELVLAIAHLHSLGFVHRWGGGGCCISGHACSPRHGHCCHAPPPPTHGMCTCMSPADRDLKPENVLLDSEGHIRVTDFGLAKGNISDAEHSRTNSFIGTMEYMVGTRGKEEGGGGSRGHLNC